VVAPSSSGERERSRAGGIRRFAGCHAIGDDILDGRGFAAVDVPGEAGRTNTTAS
jgi:hypothetical protein